MKEKITKFYAVKDKKACLKPYYNRFYSTMGLADKRSRALNECCGEDRFYAVPVEVKEMLEK